MKNRRILVAAFLCFAMLITAVGYATLSGHLTVKGIASYDKDAAEDGFVGNLEFTNASVDQSGSAASVSDEATATGQTATFTVRTLATAGEKAIFSYTLTNNNTVSARITVSATHDDGTTANPTTTFSAYQVEYIKVGDVQMQNPSATPAPEYLLPASQSVTVEVCIVLPDTPSTDIAEESYFLHLTATSVDP